MIEALALWFFFAAHSGQCGLFLAQTSQERQRLIADGDPISFLTRPDHVCNDTASDTPTQK